MGILSRGHLTYETLVWSKVTSLSSTASKRKCVKNQENSEFLSEQNKSLLMEKSSSVIFFDEMRLKRLLRPLRLLRSLRPLRFLMPENASVCKVQAVFDF